jgi:hypothetical protein
LLWIRVGESAVRSYAALGAATLAGVLAAIPPAGSAPDGIVVSQSTTVEQVGDGSLISMRGTIEYPAFADYAIRVPDFDGNLTARRTAEPEHWLDDAGAPVRRGTFGRGALDEIEVDGVADYAPFEISGDGDSCASATARMPLDRLLVSRGFSDRHAGTLALARPPRRGCSPGPTRRSSGAAARPPVTFEERRFACASKARRWCRCGCPIVSRQAVLD